MTYITGLFPMDPGRAKYTGTKSKPKLSDPNPITYFDNVLSFAQSEINMINIFHTQNTYSKFISNDNMGQ